MTLEEIRRSGKDMLSPADIAEVIGSDQETIRVTARKHPERVRFPFCFIGNRLKVPKEGFLNWLEGRQSQNRPLIEEE